MNKTQTNPVIATVSMMLAVSAAHWVGYAHGETVTLQATLEADTFFASNAANTKYEAVKTFLSSNYFYMARDHVNVTRFAALQWRMPVCPADMRVSEVRLNLYSQAGTSGAGTLGFAALTDNPDLTTATWNTGVSDGYITGRSAATYVVQLGSNSVWLSETLTNAISTWRWNTLRSSRPSTPGLTNSLAEHVSNSLSGSSSNTLTLLTLPLSGNGLTEWRGGSLEAGSNAVMEIDFVPANIALSVTVTNNLLVSLQSASVMADANGGASIWPDAASRGGWQDFSQPATNRRPAITSTEMPSGAAGPVLDFSASNIHYLELGPTAALATNTLTWFVVFKPDLDGNNATRAIFCSSGEMDSDGGPVVKDYYWGSLIDGDGSDFRIFAADDQASMVQLKCNPTATHQWFAIGGVWNGTAASCNGNDPETLTLRLLSADHVNNAEGVGTNVNAVTTGHIMTRLGRLGNVDDFSRLFDGQMAEVLIYDTALSPADMETVMEYLDLKYFKRIGTLIKVY
jgi:hypothetical protein